jgi:hypothetical protein
LTITNYASINSDGLTMLDRGIKVKSGSSVVGQIDSKGQLTVTDQITVNYK